MCGIVGFVGASVAAPIILAALRRLEYRGYDSAGIATLVDGHIERRRAEGKLANLASVLDSAPLGGNTGIGHTRWATHGAPTEGNAHPHGTPRVSLVHNGIIENHRELRAELEGEGQEFSSETDTETVAQLIDLHLRRGMTPVQAAGAALGRLHGAYALAILFAGHPDLVIGAQFGAPLAVGFGEDEMCLGSDAVALAPLTRRVAYLRDGDWAVVTRRRATFLDSSGEEVHRPVQISSVASSGHGRGGYRHFMEKELHEHPTVIGDTLHRMIDPATRSVVLPHIGIDAQRIERVSLAACGGAYYAALAGRGWIEDVARIPADIDVASEFRYRAPPMMAGTLGLLVSQSGETADTLAALKYMQGTGTPVLSVVNVAESTMARCSDAVLQTVAGPEVAVASTKAFTAQLTALACLALGIGRAKGSLSLAREHELTAGLLQVPAAAAAVLGDLASSTRAAARLVHARDVLYLGRGTCYAIALEGALKLKEICYIHAEAYAAGEMKHGPIALIDRDMPVVAIVPSGPLFEKTASNLQEAAARGAQLIVLSDADGAARLQPLAAETIVLPRVNPFVAPILYAIMVQMIAYHVAVMKGTDVDQPRNLAKSVTVE